mmetsp:Transcript_23473/g.33525  ORF Transcript_23473/g.33525 Transcript_23473/m.33525 type:complete len:84 (+) Transcript_23473:8-259(+)
MYICRIKVKWRERKGQVLENEKLFPIFFFCCQQSHNVYEEIFSFATPPSLLTLSTFPTTIVPQSHPSSVPFQYHNYSIHPHHA